MKKYILLLLVFFLYSCGDNSSLEIESYADYSSDISYKVGSKRDTRLTFFDINEFKQIRTIPNNLTEGTLKGRVQFAQTHTIDPNNNAERNEPSLIPFRNALLLFTPQEELSSLTATVTATYNNVKNTNTYTMNTPINMPNSDRNNANKKDVTYSKRSYSVMLPYNMVTPDMKITFNAVTKTGKILDGAIYNNTNDLYTQPSIEFAAPQEGVFLFLKLGMLVGVPTDPVYQFDMIDDAAHAMAEYFQTVPFASLVNGKYEDVVLNEVILSSGKIYTGQSDYQNPDAYSGDMREDVAKAQFSVGIDLANKGVASSPLNQSHEIAHDMFYFTVHHTQGKYAGKVQGHGLSGGNGIGTLYASSGNEFSHEVGHGYNLGHYPFSDTVAYGSIHGYQTGWGYDAYHNRMRANIAWNSNGGEETFMQYFIPPFQKLFNWNKDSMAGGWVDSAISRYTHNTAMTTRQIQQNIKDRYFLSDSKLNNEYVYMQWDSANKKVELSGDISFLQQRINPTEKGVEVITVLGGYDPENPTQSVLYPHLRGNWGNIFGSLFQTIKPTGNIYLEITYNDSAANPVEYVLLNESRYQSNIINKFHVNIPASKKPIKVVLYNKGVAKTINIAASIYDTPMDKPVIIGKEKGYQDVIAKDVASLNSLLNNKNVASYTLTDNEKYLIDTLSFNNSIELLEANPKAIANDYLNKQAGIKKIDDFIEENYELLENNDTQKDTELANIISSSGLGKVEYYFNQSVINDKCMTVSTDDNMTVSVATCNNLENQRWVMDSLGRIHSAVYPGYCLELGKMQNLQLCSENLNQQWKVKTDTGKIQYENIGKPNNCIDNSVSEPNKIIAYQCNSGANQQFKEEISEDDNKYLSIMQGSLIEDIWKYIPASVEVAP